MKVVLLAGGAGTRISEESEYKPKPLIEIGGMPILWHIMKEYSYYGYHEFIICGGYKQHQIKKWFADYFLYKSDVTFDLTHENRLIIQEQHLEPWKVTVVDTGLNTMTGGRIQRVQKYIGSEPFMVTYGDGVCDIAIDQLVEFHRSHGKIATITSVEIEQQKGIIQLLPDNSVRAFREKNRRDSMLINAGYMVFNPEIFDYIQHGDTTALEGEPMKRLAEDNQLMSYHHKGFWQCMDTKKEKDILEAIWESGEIPWKRWE